MGCSGLCNFISPLMEGAEGLKFMYFHLLSLRICLALFYCVFNLGLERVSGVSNSGNEVVPMQELLLCRQYDNGISLSALVIMTLYFLVWI
jgi:hypothetical protein